MISTKGELEQLKQKEKVLADLDIEIEISNKRLSELRKLRDKVTEDIENLKAEIENAGKKSSGEEEAGDSGDTDDKGESEDESKSDDGEDEDGDETEEI